MFLVVCVDVCFVGCCCGLVVVVVVDGGVLFGRGCDLVCGVDSGLSVVDYSVFDVECVEFFRGVGVELDLVYGCGVLFVVEDEDGGFDG